MKQLYILLAILQGFLEWWPISSTSVLILVSKQFGFEISTSYSIALVLHLPSGLAAFLLFKKRFLNIVKEVLKLNMSSYTKKYTTSLLISILIGLPLYLIYVELAREYSLIALLIIGIGLLITTIFLLVKPSIGLRDDVSWFDWLITGLLQGFSVLPGFSRSGLTIGYLCIRGYKPFKAVETSILLAIPVLIIAGLYNLNKISFELIEFLIISLIVFITTYLSGKILINLSQKLRVYLFTVLLAILVFLNIVLEIFTK